MWELMKSLPDFLVTLLIVSTMLMFIKNKRIRNTLAAIAGVLGLLWLLVALILSALTSGSVTAFVAVFVLLCLLMFLIRFGSQALSKRASDRRP